MFTYEDWFSIHTYSCQKYKKKYAARIDGQKYFQGYHSQRMCSQTLGFPFILEVQLKPASASSRVVFLGSSDPPSTLPMSLPFSIPTLSL